MGGDEGFFSRTLEGGLTGASIGTVAGTMSSFWQVWKEGGREGGREGEREGSRKERREGRKEIGSAEPMASSNRLPTLPYSPLPPPSLPTVRGGQDEPRASGSTGPSYDLCECCLPCGGWCHVQGGGGVDGDVDGQGGGGDQ